MSKSSASLADRLRAYTQPALARVGAALHRAHIHPDALTWAGAVVCGVAAVQIGQGALVWGGVWFALSGIFDILDGAVARARQSTNPFGALLDSTLDRYADCLIFAGISYYYAAQNRLDLMLLAWVAMMGTYAVSYLRARAGNPDVGVPVTVGWFSRLERIVLLVAALWFHVWLLEAALWVLAVGTNVTAAQRMLYIWRRVRPAPEIRRIK